MSLSRPLTFTNDSPIFQHSVLSPAFHGRLVALSHFFVGSSPAKLQICPAVGHLVMSMCASRPAEMTGPIPQMDCIHSPTGWASAKYFSADPTRFSRVSFWSANHEKNVLGSALLLAARSWLPALMRWRCIA